MGEMVITYDTLSLSQQVLERQESHAHRIASYLPAQADIGDSTGFLLSIFDPLSKLAVEVGSDAAKVLAALEQAMAAAVGDTQVDVADQDGKVGDAFTKLFGRLGTDGADDRYPELGNGPALPAAGQGAPGDYGDVESFFWQKGEATAQALSGGVSDIQGLIDGLTPTGHVTELADASSFLVAPQAPDNPVSDLRWSAGALLGSIDWVAEKFIGFSILDRCVFHPFAGDWQSLFKNSEAWHHAGDAAQAMTRNHAGLVASTPATWQGLSGDSFRLAMTTIAGATYGLSAAYSYAGDLVKTLSTVCKLACSGIGALLKMIADKLIKMAAEAATPVIGWIVGAVTAYDDIQDIIKWVRRVNTLIETIASAIQDFAEAKTSILTKYQIIEDLAQGAVGSAAA
ncbi:MAG: hypothetical protein QOD98_3119 [Nocardioidaceae bacterium]|jgi:uncharacterized protein YukE|nr:hypothetical protein [Nocardioidaceae bacterium]